MAEQDPQQKIDQHAQLREEAADLYMHLPLEQKQYLQFLDLQENARLVHENFKGVYSQLPETPGRDSMKSRLEEAAYRGDVDPEWTIDRNARHIIEVFTTLLMVYTGHAGEIYKGYQPVFTREDQGIRQNSSFTGNDKAMIDKYAKKYEDEVVFASRCQEMGITLAQSYRDFCDQFAYVKALNGAWNATK